MDAQTLGSKGCMIQAPSRLLASPKPANIKYQLIKHISALVGVEIQWGGQC